MRPIGAVFLAARLTFLTAPCILAGCQPDPVSLGMSGSASSGGTGAGGIAGIGGGSVTVEPHSGGAAGASSSVCTTVSIAADLRPAYLAFAFDASGSMGEMDCPFWNHDPNLKWSPVVDSVTSFLEAPNNDGIWASMTIFPAPSDKCETAQYAIPDVPMTALPSASFRAALRAYELEVGLDDYTDPMPVGGAAWRGGTPSRAVIAATAEFLTQLRPTDPDSTYALVLVTDGIPQGCGNDTEHYESTLSLVQETSDRGLPTYVIGVAEPPVSSAGTLAPWEQDGQRVWACLDGEGDYRQGYDQPETPYVPPNNLDRLSAIAQAGGTGDAFLINTGNPAATRDSLQAAIEDIRQRTVECSIELPEPPSTDVVFEQEKLDVRFSLPGQTTRLAYDPSCEPGGGWFYDDEADPTQIILCQETCSALQTEPDSELVVDFLCEEREPVVK